MASIPANAMAAAGSSPTTTSGVMAAKISGPSEESGPSTRIFDGPIDGIADEAGDRGVQTVHRRQPGELGVGHALGDQDRRQDDPRHHVGAQPSPLVRAERRKPGHMALHRHQPPTALVIHLNSSDDRGVVVQSFTQRSAVADHARLVIAAGAEGRSCLLRVSVARRRTRAPARRSPAASRTATQALRPSDRPTCPAPHEGRDR